MKLSAKTKAWLIDNMGLTKDATEEDFGNALTKALVEGKLTAEKLAELQTNEQASAANALLDRFDGFMKSVTERLDKIESGKAAGTRDAGTEQDADIDADANKGSDANVKSGAPEAPTGTVVDGAKMGGQAGSNPRVKDVSEMYSKSRSEMHYPERDEKGRKHQFAGQRLFEGGSTGKRYIDAPSELDMAVNGAYVKWCLNQGRPNGAGLPKALRMTEHDQKLIEYALHNCKWAGVIGGEGSEDNQSIGLKGEMLTERMRKAVLDDNTSGGLEVAPIMFDDAIITTPLLNGEFFPNVNVVNITRGRRIEGASMGNVTISSGGADGTAIPLFSTASYIAAFDTTIYVANGAIELGLDFLSDSPVDVAGMVVAQYGQQLLTWLDDQICNGDGTTEPEGILVASGTQSVGSANGSGGPATVGDYEGLLFGVGKEYKAGFQRNRIMFGANETTYQRARSIAVGSGDQRRVFGMTHEDYMLLGHPYGIQGNISNSKAFFGVMPRYRMYRRLGLTMRTTTEGKELVRANQMLITARARFGGQIEDGNAFAVMTDLQS